MHSSAAREGSGGGGGEGGGMLRLEVLRRAVLQTGHCRRDARQWIRAGPSAGRLPPLTRGARCVLPASPLDQ